MDERVAFARVMSVEEDRLYAQFLDERYKLFAPQLQILAFHGDTWISMFAQYKQVTEHKFMLEPIGPVRFRDIDLELTTCIHENDLTLATLQTDVNLRLIAVSRHAAAFETMDIVPVGTKGTITLCVAQNTFNVEAVVVQQLFTDETSYLLCEIHNLTRLAQASWYTIAAAI